MCIRDSSNDWYETVKLNYGIDYMNGHSRHFEPIPDTWVKMRDILLFLSLIHISDVPDRLNKSVR